MFNEDYLNMSIRVSFDEYSQHSESMNANNYNLKKWVCERSISSM